MAGVVASKVRKQRAIALSLKDSKAGEEDGKSRQTEIPEPEGQSRESFNPGYARGRHSRVHPTNSPKSGALDNSGSSYIILYIGLGMVAVGLVITFVGLGDKGFKTLELQLVGPTLIGCGFIFAILQIMLCTFPSLGKHCCDQNEESEKLLREEQLLEDFHTKNNVQTNGTTKPHRNVIRNNSGNIFIHPQEKKQKNIIHDHEENVESFRPILKAARQKSMNGCPNFSSRKDFEDSFSFRGEEAKLKTNTLFLNGSSKYLHSSEMILNSRRLFGDKELVAE